MKTLTTACCVADRARRGDQFDAVHPAIVLRQRRPSAPAWPARPPGSSGCRTPGTARARVSKNCRSGALGGSSWAPELRSSRSQHRHGQDAEDQQHPADHQPGPALRPPGQPGEEALVGGDVTEPVGQLPHARDPAEQPRPDHPVAGQRQQRRHQGQRDQQRDDHDADPGGADRPQDPGLEQQQAGQADRHGDAGEQHRAAGGRHGRRPARRCAPPWSTGW